MRASEPVPLDPELDAKLNKLDSLTETQINDKLQAMLVSVSILIHRSQGFECFSQGCHYMHMSSCQINCQKDAL